MHYLLAICFLSRLFTSTQSAKHNYIRDIDSKEIIIKEIRNISSENLEYLNNDIVLAEEEKLRLVSFTFPGYDLF